jgi:hypothetical protein
MLCLLFLIAFIIINIEFLSADYLYIPTTANAADKSVFLDTKVLSAIPAAADKLYLTYFEVSAPKKLDIAEYTKSKIKGLSARAAKLSIYKINFADMRDTLLGGTYPKLIDHAFHKIQLVQFRRSFS